LAAPLFYICAKIISLKPKLIYFIPAVAWFVIIFLLLVMPNDDIPTGFFASIPNFDKMVHAGIFGFEVLMLSWPFFSTPLASRKLFLKITIGVIAYGVIMEFVQKLTPDRDYDTLDMVADSVGAVIAFFVANAWFKLYIKRRQRRMEKNKPL